MERIRWYALKNALEQLHHGLRFGVYLGDYLYICFSKTEDNLNNA